MANKNRNNRNNWDDRDSDYRNDDRNTNWNRDSRQNTSMHQNRNEGRQSHQENYGLGDTSQGSENYGHIDDGRGARYYGTGNYGGYFGRGSDEDDARSRQQENRGGHKGRKHHGGGKGHGNSNINGRGDGSGSGSGERYSGYGQGRKFDWNEDRDWWDKTTDEVSSWFGDEKAENRREMDQRYGPHRGKGPKGYSRSDEKIKEDVEERLYHDSFIDASDIEVTVNDGEVTLTGTVDHKQTRRRAEDCADAVAGVKEVSLNLKVIRPSDSGS